MPLALVASLILLMGAVPQHTPGATSAPATSPAAAGVQGGDQSTTVVSRTTESQGLADQAATLFGPTFKNTELFAWVMLLGAIVVGLAAGRIAQAILIGLSGRMEKRGWAVRGAVIRHAAGPAGLALIAFGLGMGLTGIHMTEDVRTVAFRIVALLYLVAIAWYAYNLVGMVDIILRRLVLRTRSPLDDTILSVVRKALRVFLLVMMGLFIAENVFGAHIGTWLAGLGIAGLAVSLAAQDPIKNLFGSFTMLVERPFGLGDRIIFANIDGTVEEIGLRSTRIRTAAGHLVAVPNMKFTDNFIENISRRPSLRRTINLNIPYDTPPEKVEEALRLLQDILREKDIEAELNLPDEPPQVLLADFKFGSLSMTVNYWYGTKQKGRDWLSFQRHAERVNLKILRAFKQAGIKLV